MFLSNRGISIVVVSSFTIPFPFNQMLNRYVYSNSNLKMIHIIVVILIKFNSDFFPSILWYKIYNHTIPLSCYHDKIYIALILFCPRKKRVLQSEMLQNFAIFITLELGILANYHALSKEVFH